MPYIFLQTAALSGLLAVALGAFGAHALKNRLAGDMQAIYQTAVSYHFIHTLALLGVALLLLHIGKSSALATAAISFIVGIVIFSGSLYLLSITGIRWLGAITPIGGLAFMLGWLSLFLAAWKATV